MRALSSVALGQFLWLYSFHSVFVGFAILCSPRWILVNINALTVTFVEIWGNCPCYFARVNDRDFESPWLWDINPFEQLCFDCICWFIVPFATDSSVLSQSNVVWNRWTRSIRMCLNQWTANYVSLRSKRSRTTRTKFGSREGVFRIQAARKMGQEQKGGRSLIFRADRMRKNSFARPEFRSRGTGTLGTQAKLCKHCLLHSSGEIPESAARIVYTNDKWTHDCKCLLIIVLPA